VMYEMLTGSAPFKALNYNALLCAILEGEPKPLSELRTDLDPKLYGIVKRAMSKNPEHRFPSANAMARALSSWAGQELSGPTSAPESSSAAFARTLVGRVDEEPERVVTTRKTKLSG
jgi:serine/threonine protein kinase